MNGYAPQPQFPYLRQVVDPSIAMLPPWALQARIDSEFGEGAAETLEGDLEGVFDGIGRAFSSAARDVGHFAQKAVPAVATVGGGVLQGAMAGSSAGLPGIIAGAAVGGVGAGLSKYGTGTARTVGNVMSGVTQMAGQLTPMGQVGGALGSTLSGLGSAMGPGARGRPIGPQLAQAAQMGLSAIPAMRGMGAGGAGGLAQMGMSALQGGARSGAGGFMQAAGGLLSNPRVAGAVTSLFGGSSAAGQFASMIQRPEFQQALGALRLGGLGRSTVPVGSSQTQVPTAAFAQLLSHLAGQVAAEMAEMAGEGAESADLEFMQDSSGEFLGDPANLDDRASRLWTLLNDAQAERLTEAVASEWADAEAEYGSYEAEWGSDSEQELYDQLDLAEAEAIDMALADQEMSDAW